MPIGLKRVHGPLTYVLKVSAEASLPLIEASYPQGVVTSSILPPAVCAHLTKRLQGVLDAMEGDPALPGIFPSIVSRLFVLRPLHEVGLTPEEP